MILAAGRRSRKVDQEGRSRTSRLSPLPAVRDSGSMALIETNWRITKSALEEPKVHVMVCGVFVCVSVINSQNKKYAPRVCCCCYCCSWMPFGGSPALTLPISISLGYSFGLEYAYFAVNCLFCHYSAVGLATLHTKAKQIVFIIARSVK